MAVPWDSNCSSQGRSLLRRRCDQGCVITKILQILLLTFKAAYFFYKTSPYLGGIIGTRKATREAKGTGRTPCSYLHLPLALAPSSAHWGGCVCVPAPLKDTNGSHLGVRLLRYQWGLSGSPQPRVGGDCGGLKTLLKLHRAVSPPKAGSG